MVPASCSAPGMRRCPCDNPTLLDAEGPPQPGAMERAVR